MEWTGGKIEMLIEWYSQFPFLFDAKQADYHNKIKRFACLSEIAVNLGTTGRSRIDWNDNQCVP